MTSLWISRETFEKLASVQGGRRGHQTPGAELPESRQAIWLTPDHCLQGQPTSSSALLVLRAVGIWLGLHWNWVYGQLPEHRWHRGQEPPGFWTLQVISGALGGPRSSAFLLFALSFSCSHTDSTHTHTLKHGAWSCGRRAHPNFYGCRGWWAESLQGVGSQHLRRELSATFLRLQTREPPAL